MVKRGLADVYVFGSFQQRGRELATDFRRVIQVLVEEDVDLLELNRRAVEEVETKLGMKIEEMQL